MTSNKEQTPFSLMQSAVDIVDKSPHPTNKIAATLRTRGEIISATNMWPAPIARTLGPDVRIGNSSGTVHAETACILRARKSAGGALYVTDPPCPNCVKYMVEAGIKALFIDHKGFEKDFAQRRGDAFHGLSVALCRAGGIAVSKIYRKDQKIELIVELGKAFYAPELFAKNIAHKDNKKAFKDFIAEQIAHLRGTPFAAALAEDEHKNLLALSVGVADLLAQAQMPLPPTDEKYNPVLQPLNRLLMSARREGFNLMPDYIFSSRVPTARELVNIVGAGISELWVGDMANARDENGHAALKQLRDAEVLRVQIL